MRSRAFPKTLRVCHQKEISQIFAEGLFFRSGFLKFKWTPTQLGRVRTVISVSKRVGSSPQRNRIKRLIRESLRHSTHIHCYSMNLAIFVTVAPLTPPQIIEVQRHIELFFAHLA